MFFMDGIDLIGKEVSFWVRSKTKTFKTNGIIKDYKPRPKTKKQKDTIMKGLYLITCNGVYHYKLTRSEFNLL